MNGQKMLLIVEDDETTLRILSGSLKRQGYLVATASSLTMAASAIRSNSGLFAVVWDGNIGEETSLELIGKTKKMLPFAIFVTMSSNPYLRREQLRLGCNVAVKSKTPSLIIEALRRKH